MKEFKETNRKVPYIHGLEEIQRCQKEKMEATKMSNDRSIDKDVVYRYTIERYSAIKENEIMPFFLQQHGQVYIDYCTT